MTGKEWRNSTASLYQVSAEEAFAFKARHLRDRPSGLLKRGLKIAKARMPVAGTHSRLKPLGLANQLPRQRARRRGPWRERNRGELVQPVGGTLIIVQREAGHHVDLYGIARYSPWIGNIRARLGRRAA
jgi:hypothetical protein